MPRGSKPGERRGGRKKGTPNRVTADAREAFRMVYEGRLGDLDRWIKETGDGYQAVHFLADGTKIPYVEKNPGKASDLLLRMAEHFVPKLARHEHVGDGGGAVKIVIRKYGSDGND
jgi:hypothetical protein